MKNKKTTLLGVLLSIALPWGCSGTQQPCPTAPDEVTSQPTPTAEAADHINEHLVGVASSVDGLFRMRLRVDAEGNVEKFAVYHHGADPIPQAVRDAAAERFPGAEIRYYESEVYAEHGRVYEVSVTTAEGQEGEISAREDGSLLYTEVQIEPSQLPEVVASQVSQLVPGGEIVEVETKEGPIVNEISVECRAGELEHYLRFTPEGELISHSLRVPATIDIPVGQ